MRYLRATDQLHANNAKREQFLRCFSIFSSRDELELVQACTKKALCNLMEPFL